MIALFGHTGYLPFTCPNRQKRRESLKLVSKMALKKWNLNFPFGMFRLEKQDCYPASRGFSLAWLLAFTKSNKPTAKLTCDGNDFPNAKNHARAKRTLGGYRCSVAPENAPLERPKKLCSIYFPTGFF